MTILLLESDRQLAGHTTQFFKWHGYDIKHHSDPQKAIESLDKDALGLVITDLMLAGRSGIEFLYELRSYPEWQNLPVIVTGSIRPDEVDVFSRTFEELGVARYMPKSTTSLNDLVTQVKILHASAVR